MYKKITFWILLLALLLPELHAQIPKNSWIFSFGIKYPRLVNHNYTRPDALNAGGFFGFQRNFSEHVGLRMALDYNYLQGVYGSPEVKGATHAFDLSADLIPCQYLWKDFFSMSVIIWLNRFLLVPKLLV